MILVRISINFVLSFSVMGSPICKEPVASCVVILRYFFMLLLLFHFIFFFFTRFGLALALAFSIARPVSVW